MKTSALLIAALALTASAGSQASGGAQSGGATGGGMPASLTAPNGPDIAGVRVGITANEARQLLQKINPRYKITPIIPVGTKTEVGFKASVGNGVTDANGGDIFHVLYNEAGVVWLLRREQTVTADKAVLKDTLIKSLTAKYDQPGGEVKYRAPGNLNLVWNHDMSGKQLASFSTDVNNSPCREVPYARYYPVSESFSIYEKYAPTCSMIISARSRAFRTGNQNMLDVYGAEIIAPPLQHDAGALNAAATAREQQRKNLENTVRDNKPQL